MAQYTCILPANNSVYTSEDSPNTTFQTSPLKFSGKYFKAGMGSNRNTGYTMLTFDTSSMLTKKRIVSWSLEHTASSFTHTYGFISIDCVTTSVYANAKYEVPTIGTTLSEYVLVEDINNVTFNKMSLPERNIGAYQHFNIQNNTNIRTYKSDSYPFSDALTQNHKSMAVYFGVFLGATAYPTYGREMDMYYEYQILNHLNPTYRPILKVIVEDVVPSPQATTFISGFIDKKIDNVFSWEQKYLSYSDVINNLDAKDLEFISVKYRWRNKGDSVHIEKELVKASEYIVPANTFTSANIEWQVECSTNDGFTGYSPWYQLTTVDSISSAVAVSPKNVFLQGDENNTFEWQHVISTGSPQSRAELQYSTNGTSWTLFKTLIGSETSCIIPAGTLPGGSVQWRVRTYNTDSVTGTWSEPVTILVHASPTKPTISSITQTPHPVIKWQSAEQQAYEVKADDWTSGPIFGTVKSCQIPLWLADGSHTISVRIQSALALWSDWSDVQINVKNIGEENIALSAQPVPNGVNLIWTGSTKPYIIYRNGKPIALLEEGVSSFTDWLAVGNNNYQIRVVNGENYGLSNSVEAKTICRTGVISAINKIDWLSLHVKRSGTPTHTISNSVSVAKHYYSGRKNIVTEVSNHTERQHVVEYSYLPNERHAAEQIAALLGKTVIYKNPQGDIVIGVLQALNDKRDTASDLSLTIIENDWQEVGADVY